MTGNSQPPVSRLSLLTIGGGAHGRIVAETAAEGSQYNVIGFAYADAAKHGITIGSWRVLGNWRSILADAYFVSIGVNAVRKAVFEQLLVADRSVATIVSPHAFVSDAAELGAGTVVLAGAVVQAGAKVGRNVIINAGAVVDHDTVIGDHAHVGPNVTVASFAQVAQEEVVPPGAVRCR
jgi:acetyltransferase EpsM